VVFFLILLSSYSIPRISVRVVIPTIKLASGLLEMTDLSVLLIVRRFPEYKRKVSYLPRSHSV
jgi:hypothetical protein